MIPEAQWDYSSSSSSPLSVAGCGLKSQKDLLLLVAFILVVFYSVTSKPSSLPSNSATILCFA